MYGNELLNDEGVDGMTVFNWKNSVDVANNLRGKNYYKILFQIYCYFLRSKDDSNYR